MPNPTSPSEAKAIPIERDRVHRLKTWPQHFAALKTGAKTFEVRENDRDFRVGDLLILREFCPITSGPLASSDAAHPEGNYTGNSMTRWVTCVTDICHGLRGGYVVLGLRDDHPPLTEHDEGAINRYVTGVSDHWFPGTKPAKTKPTETGIRMPKTGEAWRHYNIDDDSLYTIIGVGPDENGIPTVVYTPYGFAASPMIHTQALGRFLQHIEATDGRIPKHVQRFVFEREPGESCAFINPELVR